MTKQAVLYTRVSTDPQDKGYSPETQLEACRNYAEAHSYIIVGKFQDTCSGTIRMADRPQGSKMLAMLARKEAAAVIVYTSDRLSRNLAHMLILREDWQRTGIELHYVNRGKAEDTAESRMTENIEGVFAEYWREKIIEGSKRGRNAKAQAGKWVGSCPTPYGFHRIGSNREVRLVIDEDGDARIVWRIFCMYAGKHGYKPISFRAICETLQAEGVPSPRNGRGWYPVTIMKCIISNRIYLGEFQYNGHICHMPELAMIDQDLWDTAQARRKKNKERAKRNRKYEYLLTSHIVCLCGGRMVGSTSTRASGKVYRYYECTQRNQYGHLISCKETGLKVAEADATVWQWVKELMTDEAKLDKGITEMIERRTGELESKRKELGTTNSLIEKSERKIKRLVVFAGDAGDDETAAEYHAQAKAEGKVKAQLIAERDKLLAELSQGEITEADRQTIKAIAARVRQKLGGQPTYEQKRELLDLLDLRVQVIYEHGERKLFATCGLAADGETLPISPPIALQSRC